MSLSTSKQPQSMHRARIDTLRVCYWLFQLLITLYL